jgi:hypothetical protein
MPQLVSVTLVLVGLIHLLPLAGVLGPKRLHALYGLTLDETNLVILMRHRAVLFGLLGALMIEAAFNTAHQWLALVIAFVSVVSYLVIERGEGNAQLRRVAHVDWVAFALILLGACARWFSA